MRIIIGLFALVAVVLAACAPKNETVWQLEVRTSTGQVVESVRGDNCAQDGDGTWLSRDDHWVLKVARAGQLTAVCRRLR